MNIEQARSNMIERQIRAGGNVHTQDVLDALEIVRREHFVPRAHADFAFADIEIPLPCGENMLTPIVEARILEALAIKPHERVLEIGAGSGYMAALLAFRARHVTTVEIEPQLAEMAERNLTDYGVANVDVELGDGLLDRAGTDEAYDVIVLSGSLPALPDTFLKQIKIGGRIMAFIGDAPAMSAQITTRTSETACETRRLFETVVKPLRQASVPSHFRF